MDRKEFLALGGAVGASVLLPGVIAPASAEAAGPRIDGASYAPKFSAALPRPRRVSWHWQQAMPVDIVQFTQQVLDGYPATTLYGYQLPGGPPSWPGATLVQLADRALNVEWRNQLPASDLPVDQAHLLPVDMSMPMGLPPLVLPQGNIPTVTHLHGGHTESSSDGLPDAWFTQQFSQTGPAFVKPNVRYANDQRAATLWYHDHAIGITRLNVFAGLSGMYLLRDDAELALTASGVLPRGRHEIELVIQDRWFTTDGQLSIDTTTSPPNGIEPTIFADFILVNGKPWPVLDVEPRKYRFRILNGSDSRVYVLSLGAPMLQVGCEQGMLPQAVSLTRLPLAPGQRCDVVIDFSAHASSEIILRNFGIDGAFFGFKNGNGDITNNPGDTAYGDGSVANPASTGQIMKFRVAATRSNLPNATVAAGTVLGPTIAPLTASVTRGVITFFGTDDLGRNMELQGSLAGGTYLWEDPSTENPVLGVIEAWEIHNTSPIAHPIHLHLVAFRLINRQAFTWTSTTKPMMMMDGGTANGGTLSNIVRTGAVRGPDAHETGPMDTVICYPGEITRVVAQFDRPGRYVWHCHILHHEDHDMMRPFIVTQPVGAPHA
jgi:spore coat protein A